MFAFPTTLAAVTLKEERTPLYPILVDRGGAVVNRILPRDVIVSLLASKFVQEGMVFRAEDREAFYLNLRILVLSDAFWTDANLASVREKLRAAYVNLEINTWAIGVPFTDSVKDRIVSLKSVLEEHRVLIRRSESREWRVEETVRKHMEESDDFVLRLMIYDPMVHTVIVAPKTAESGAPAPPKTFDDQSPPEELLRRMVL